jgi:hypothetical protein
MEKPDAALISRRISRPEAGLAMIPTVVFPRTLLVMVDFLLEAKLAPCS